jgi:hypothetical protein
MQHYDPAAMVQATNRFICLIGVYYNRWKQQHTNPAPTPLMGFNHFAVLGFSKLIVSS